MVTDHVTDSPHLADRPDALRLCPTRLCRPVGHGRRHRVGVPSRENRTGAGADLRHRGRPAHSDPPRYGWDRSGDRGRFRRGGGPQGTPGRGFAVSRPGLVRTNAPWCGALRVRANTSCPRCSTQPVAFPGASTDWSRTALTEAATPKGPARRPAAGAYSGARPARRDRPAPPEWIVEEAGGALGLLGLRFVLRSQVRFIGCGGFGDRRSPGGTGGRPHPLLSPRPAVRWCETRRCRPAAVEDGASVRPPAEVVVRQGRFGRCLRGSSPSVSSPPTA